MLKTYERYTKEFKLNAIRKFLYENIPARTIAREFNISCHKLILNWVNIYEKFGEEGVKDKHHKTSSKKELENKKPKTKESSTEDELRRLRAENEYLKKLLKLGRR